MGQPAAVGVSASGQVSASLRDRANAVITGTFGDEGPGKPFGLWGKANITFWASYASPLATTAASGDATVTTAGAIAKGNAISASNVPKGTTARGVSGTTITLGLPIYTLWGTIGGGTLKIYNLPQTTFLTGATVTGNGIQASTTVASVDTAAANGVGGIVTLDKATTADTPTGQRQAFEFTLAAAGISTSAGSDASFTGEAIVATGNTYYIEKSFDGGATWIVANTAAGTLAKFTAGTPFSVLIDEPELGVLYRVNCSVYASVSGTTFNYRISTTGAAASSLDVGA